MERVRHVRDRHDGESTLVQTFRFAPDVRADTVAELFRSSPLLGLDSVFGDRPGEEESTPAPSRHLRGFSPAPGFRFDVDLAEPQPNVFVVSFSQPDRQTPYLEGDAVWVVRNDLEGAELHEEINTEFARSIANRALTGSRPSLRRWLFFRVGHAQVMRGAATRMENLAHAG